MVQNYKEKFHHLISLISNLLHSKLLSYNLNRKPGKIYLQRTIPTEDNSLMQQRQRFTETILDPGNPTCTNTKKKLFILPSFIYF
jgi:hypothetical protein